MIEQLPNVNFTNGFRAILDRDIKVMQAAPVHTHEAFARLIALDIAAIVILGIIEARWNLVINAVNKTIRHSYGCFTD